MILLNFMIAKAIFKESTLTKNKKIEKIDFFFFFFNNTVPPFVVTEISKRKL